MTHAQEGWQAQLPDIILQTQPGVVSQLKLDLVAAVSSCVSRAACIDFLLRRRSHSMPLEPPARMDLALSMLKVRCGSVKPTNLMYILLSGGACFDGLI